MQNEPIAEFPSRRTFNRKAIQSLLTFSLLDTLCVNNVFADKVKPLITSWVTELHAVGRDVKDQKIKQLIWQKKVEELFAQVNLPDLLELVDFEALTKKIKYKEAGALSLRPKFQQIDGIPTKLVFGKQIFALKKGCSVVPHGHNNMATAFLVLKGALRGRHYDRIADEPKHFIIKPTIDKKFVSGKFSTVSDDKDNVHWFKAMTESAFIFNIHVVGLNPGTKKRNGRVYLDPKGEELKGGLIRAPRINYKEALERYG